MTETTNDFAMLPRSDAVPAWLLSIVVHLVALLLLALFLHGPTSRGVSAPDRTAGIVLTRIESDEKIEYFQETGAQALQEPARSNAAKVPPESAFPETAQRPSIASIHLPTTVAVPAENTPLVPARWDLSKGGHVRLLPDQGTAAILAAEAARKRNQKSLGPVTETSMFGSASAEGRSFVFVIDRSKSMGSGGLGALRVATIEFQHALAALKPNHRFHIVAYHHRRVLFGDSQQMLPATDENKQKVTQFMQGLAAFGGTDHELGLMTALYMKPDVIFFLTDGADPPLTPSQLAQIHQRAAGRTAIHSIQFGYGPAKDDSRFMQQLAEQNGGSYRYVDISQVHQ